jgi:ectoine hydroxylase-related dioxygenase (phytanoyl-CoA dioxygenase family)
MKDIFKNLTHQKEYEENGYIVIDFFSHKEVKILLDFYASLKKNKTGFYSTFGENLPEIQASISALATYRLNELMIDYRIVESDFLVKEPSENSSVMIHQDWSFVDESKHVCFNIWISLVDTNAKNGALYLMKKSHRLPYAIRGKGVPQPIRNCLTLKLDQLSYTPTLAGQAIIYDLKTIHASPPNLSRSTRVACGMAVVPNRADLLYYQYEHHTQTLSMYGINSDYSLGYKINNLIDMTLKEQTIIPESQFVQYTFDELKPLLQQPIRWKKYLSFFKN